MDGPRGQCTQEKSYIFSVFALLFLYRPRQHHSRYSIMHQMPRYPEIGLQPSPTAPPLYRLDSGESSAAIRIFQVPGLVGIHEKFRRWLTGSPETRVCLHLPDT